MDSYHKIPTVYKRDPETKFRTLLIGQYATPELEYLAHSWWTFTEKVDGTNVRIRWSHDGPFRSGQRLEYRGKSDAAVLHDNLLARLGELLPERKFVEHYPDTSMCLYGEGYGAKIQKGGGRYKPDGMDFVLFDVNIGGVWLSRENVEDIANHMGISVVPIIGHGNLPDAVNLARAGFTSTWGDFTAEGIVMRPITGLQDRLGRRIITKIKYKDFPHETQNPT